MNLECTILTAWRIGHGLAASADASITPLTDRSFCLKESVTRYLLKWVARDDVLGRNEIQVNKTMLQSANIPAPRLLFVVERPDGVVACWEWLEGTDLREHSRDLLPAAFAELGCLHLAQRHDGAVCSPTTWQTYPTTEEMLAAELELLGAPLGDPTRRSCAPSFSLLAQIGYATLIHGDMHPGNIVLAKGKLSFVDWAYARPSLNLFDLGYIQSVALADDSESAWWDIGPREAQAILPAYFHACGLGSTDGPAAHRAVMVWAQLQSHYNAMQHGNREGMARCRSSLDLLLRA